MSAALSRWLHEHTADSSISELGPHLLALIPPGASFESDQWNVISWVLRPGNGISRYLYFDKIVHANLKAACKIWILHGRMTRNLGEGSAQARLTVVAILGEVLGARSFDTLKNEDFYAAERRIRKNRAAAGAYGLCKVLATFAKWLNLRTRSRLSYVSGMKKPAKHGRKGNDAGRHEKLMPDEVIRDLIAVNSRDDISDIDRFYLQIFTIDVGAGFRVGELANLPENCLIEHDGALQLLYFPEKKGRPVPKVVPPSLVPAIRAAVSALKSSTEDLRKLAAQQRENEPVDWLKVSSNEAAACYFTSKFAHEWTADPANRLINPDAVWHKFKKKLIDAIGTLEECGGNKSEAGRRLGVTYMSLERMLAEQRAARAGELRTMTCKGKEIRSWNFDPRLINENQFKLRARTTTHKLYPSVRAIIQDAREMQLRGEFYPNPVRDEGLEAQFKRSFALIRGPGGESYLEAHEALLLRRRGRGGNSRTSDFLAVTVTDLARWLSRNDGKTKISVFQRFGIVDPRTGEIAKFTWHDVRHWLNTQYQRGGLSQQQIALIFGRKDVGQNATYDQTSSEERAERLRNAVRDGVIVGEISDTYSRLADISREQAEEYLAGALRMINIMPHGLCTLNWAMNPCPHYLSCFTCGGDSEENSGACEHLIVDRNNSGHVAEIRRLRSEAQVALKVIPSESPMFSHYLRIFSNTTLKLEQMGLGVEVVAK